MTLGEKLKGYWVKIKNWCISCCNGNAANVNVAVNGNAAANPVGNGGAPSNSDNSPQRLAALSASYVYGAKHSVSERLEPFHSPSNPAQSPSPPQPANYDGNPASASKNIVSEGGVVSGSRTQSQSQLLPRNSNVGIGNMIGQFADAPTNDGALPSPNSTAGQTTATAAATTTAVVKTIVITPAAGPSRTPSISVSTQRLIEEAEKRTATLNAEHALTSTNMASTNEPGPAP